MYIIKKDAGSRSNVMITNTDNNRTTNLGPMTSRIRDILKDNDIADITDIAVEVRLGTTNKEVISSLQLLALHKYKTVRIKAKDKDYNVAPKVATEPVNALDIFAQFM